MRELKERIYDVYDFIKDYTFQEVGVALGKSIFSHTQDWHSAYKFKRELVKVLSEELRERFEIEAPEKIPSYTFIDFPQKESPRQKDNLEILHLLATHFENHPDMRFGQLLVNLGIVKGNHNNTFYVESEETLKTALLNAEKYDL